MAHKHVQSDDIDHFIRELDFAIDGDPTSFPTVPRQPSQEATSRRSARTGPSPVVTMNGVTLSNRSSLSSQMVSSPSLDAPEEPEFEDPSLATDSYREQRRTHLKTPAPSLDFSNAQCHSASGHSNSSALHLRAPHIPMPDCPDEFAVDEVNLSGAINTSPSQVRSPFAHAHQLSFCHRNVSLQHRRIASIPLPSSGSISSSSSSSSQQPGHPAVIANAVAARAILFGAVGLASGSEQAVLLFDRL